MGRIPCSGLPAHRLVFYTIGRVPSRIHTILHSSFVLRQPPPHRIHASDFFRHGGTQTNHGTLQPCAGTSVASVHLYKAGASQYINSFVLPLSYSAQERPLSQAYAPCGCEARGHAYGADGWTRTSDFFIIGEMLLPPELRLHIAPSGRSRSPAHQERRVKRKRMEMQSLPPHLP